MAPKRKEAPEEENDAPPAGLLKTKRYVVNLTRIKGSMGLGIDDQRATMSKARQRTYQAAPEASVRSISCRWLPPSCSQSRPARHSLRAGRLHVAGPEAQVLRDGGEGGRRGGSCT